MVKKSFFYSLWALLSLFFSCTEKPVNPQNLLCSRSYVSFRLRFNQSKFAEDTIIFKALKDLKIKSIGYNTPFLISEIDKLNLPQSFSMNDSVKLIIRFSTTPEKPNVIDTLRIITDEDDCENIYKIPLYGHAYHKPGILSLSKSKDKYLVIFKTGTQTDVSIKNNNGLNVVCKAHFLTNEKSKQIPLKDFASGAYEVSVVSCNQSYRYDLTVRE